MSVKVNLLPSEIGARSKAGAQRMGLLAAFGLLLLLLAGGWWFNNGRVTAAEEDLANAEAAVGALRAELAELQPFSDLRTRYQEAQTVLATALGNEVSTAGILQDISSVFPPNAQLEELSITLQAESSPAPGGDRVVYGIVAGTGQLLLGVAPGAERLLIDLDRSVSFDNVFVTMQLDEEGIGTFSFDFELGEEVRTGRYTLPTTGGTP